MASRIARSSINPRNPRPVNRKGKKRAADALSIATSQHPEKPRIRQNRLGESEGDTRGIKRRRLDRSEESADHTISKSRPQPDEIRGDLDAEHGSDSEGNEWQMGDVDVDDDSNLDSDEAFGDSDEERFEGFAFRGSSHRQSTSASRSSAGPSIRIGEDFNLDEADERALSASSATGTEDDLGEDAVDLATALDQWEESEDDGDNQQNVSSQGLENGDENTSEEDLDSDTGFSGFSSDGDQEDDANDMIKIQSIISSLDPDVNKPENLTGPKNPPGQLTIEDLLAAHDDPSMRKSLRKHVKATANRKDSQHGKLEAPLPKRQQDRLDRAAASQNAKESLDQWVDTVKHNRRAEHLTFPLRDGRSAEISGRSRLFTAVDIAPFNELENTVQNILHESGLSLKSKDDQEDQIRAFEQLQTNKMSLAEAQARQAELRRMRELLFREEVKAKRIKRIKSKAYRRVHRKERERAAQAERDALVSAGVDMSDEERERHDRLRAEARMGAKHRNSKWARDMRQTGRAAWDDDAREAVTELAKRKDELMQRIQGNPVRGESNGSDLSSDEDGDDGSEIQNLPSADRQRRHLMGQLNRLSDRQTTDEPGSRLHAMAFMQKAENARHAQNQEDIERLKRELDMDERSEDLEDDENPVGRRSFSAAKKAMPKAPQHTTVQEFEENLPSEEDDSADQQSREAKELEFAETRQKARPSPKRKENPKSAASEEVKDSNTDLNPWLAENSRKRRDHLESKAINGKALRTAVIENNRLQRPSKSQPPASTSETSTTLTELEKVADSADEDEGKLAPFVLRNQDLVQKAFAGDNVVTDFEAEKKEAVAEEEERTTDNTLPGWGSWVGEGVSAKERKRAKGRFVQKEAGVKASDRQDAKLDQVIMNEKRVKKSTKYLAPALPHPYESQAQYERALRLPMGPEWTTKETFQNVTKPRVMVKQGVIAAMSRPMV